jgi:hypothetical protein
MDETLVKLTEAMDRTCLLFLATHTRKSKLRVAKKGLRPVLRSACDILALRIAQPATTGALKTGHPFDVDVLEIAHFPAGSGKGVHVTRNVANPRALINIGVSRNGLLVSQLTSLEPPFWVAGSSKFVTLRDLVTVGISAYDLVEQAQRLAHKICMEETTTQKGALA